MLFGWMKSLIFYLLLATIVTHMAPSNQYKQYIRYFIGLVVIVLLASPLKFLFEFGSGDLQELLKEIEHVEGQESVAGVGGSITDYYGMGIREGLKKELQGYSVEDVAIITDAGGELLQCTIYISEAKATEEMEKEIKKYKKNEKWNKVILVVLCGILLLVIVMPQKTVQTAVGQTGSSSDTTASYEVRLRELLADTYGADMVDVLIYAGDRTQTYYGSGGTETITGVLITIKKEAVTGTTIADITLAVCALFDLPAHKVAVLVKN